LKVGEKKVAWERWVKAGTAVKRKARQDPGKTSVGKCWTCRQGGLQPTTRVKNGYIAGEGKSSEGPTKAPGKLGFCRKTPGYEKGKRQSKR